MKIMFWVFCAIAVALAAAFIIIRDKKGGVLPMTLKGLATMAIIGMGFCTVIAGKQELIMTTAPMLAGVAFSFAGDVLLDYKVTFPARGRACLWGGMIAFSITHLFYITSITFISEFNLYILLSSVLIGAATAIAAIYIIKYNLGEYKIISFVYAFLVAYTAMQALYAAITTGGIGVWLMFIGGVLFFISDVILSATFFGGKDSKAYIALNHTSYYLAQLLLFIGMFAVLF